MVDEHDPMKRVHEQVGVVIQLMANTHSHAAKPVRDCYDLVLVPVATRQFRLLHDEQQEVVAYAAWAKVSPQVETKITTGTGRIMPSDWQSGDIVLLMELVARDPKLRHPFVLQLKRELFPDSTFKARRRNADTQKVEWEEIKHPDGPKRQ